MTNYDMKTSAKQIWASGDCFVTSRHWQWVSEVLCEALDLRATYHTLDIATGNGNTALSAARRGCTVTAIDLTPELLDYARRRAIAEHLQIDFREEDAENLSFEDDSFDVVLATFGIISMSALGEMFRVLKPGGKIGLANWRSDTAIRINDVFARYVPASPPVPWTNEEGLRELFGDAFRSLTITPKQFFYRFPSATDYVEKRFAGFGPWKDILTSLASDAAENLKGDLIAEVEKYNISGDETLVLPQDYLQIIAEQVNKK
ncbi:MAG TPA: class I SAM-dependent methyltransferase [Anaerolineales bacterium]|nr:class I SAM-dependent methyltransferase [Anaerolineales bacterium]